MVVRVWVVGITLVWIRFDVLHSSRSDYMWVMVMVMLVLVLVLGVVLVRVHQDSAISSIDILLYVRRRPW